LAKAGDVILGNELHRLEDNGVDIFHVIDGQGYSEDVFVEGSGEESVQLILSLDSLPNYSSYEVENIKMVWIDVRIRIGLVGVPLLGLLEETIIGIEHLLG